MARANRLRGGRRRSSASRSRRKAVNPVRLTVFLAIVLLLAVGLIWGLNSIRDTDRFVSGVIVNGTDLGGLTFDQGAELVRRQAEERLHANSYELVFGDRSWLLTPEQMGATMDVEREITLAKNIGHVGNFFQRRAQAVSARENPMEFTSEIHYTNEGYLDQLVDQIKSELDVAMVEGRAEPDDRANFTYYEGVPGVEVDAQALREMLNDIVIEGGESTIPLAEPVVRVVYPTQTVESLKQCTQPLFDKPVRTTLAQSGANRTQNVRRALEPFNKMCVMPNQTVDVSDKIGARTIENGFLKADEYDGNTIISGIGGGTCQASTTLYQAMVRAGMLIESRKAHSMIVNYTEPSLDAAISQKKNLIFTNKTNDPIYIFTSVDNEYARVWVYGRPREYNVQLYSEISAYIAPTQREYKQDTTGKRVRFTDEEVLEEAGKMGVRSVGYIIYYSWETGQEVKREELSRDTYSAGIDKYWVGITPRDAGW